MEGDYNFWKDFFDTYQSLPDWMKFAWLIVPPSFTLGLVALVMRMRIISKRAETMEAGTLAYTVYQDEDDGLRIYAHNGLDALPDQRLEPQKHRQGALTVERPE